MKALQFALIVSILVGCKTYNMTTDSLKAHLSKIDPKLVTQSDDSLALPAPAPGIGSEQVGVPIVTGSHLNNGLTEVRCTDRDRIAWIFSINYLTTARLTEKNGHKKKVLFNSMYLKNNLVYASQSNLIDAPIKPININDIVKVELKFSGSQKRKVER